MESHMKSLCQILTYHMSVPEGQALTTSILHYLIAMKVVDRPLLGFQAFQTLIVKVSIPHSLGGDRWAPLHQSYHLRYWTVIDHHFPKDQE